MPDTTPVDMSDVCGSLSIIICIANVWGMFRLSFPGGYLSSKGLMDFPTSKTASETAFCNSDIFTEPPELRTPDVGAEPTLEVGALLRLVMPEVVLAPDGVFVADGRALADVVLAPELAVLPDEDDEAELPDDEVEPVSALAGEAAATTAPPRAARPNVTRAAVPAIRVLNIDFLFL